jgi:hypothetical protein
MILMDDRILAKNIEYDQIIPSIDFIIGHPIYSISDAS